MSLCPEKILFLPGASGNTHFWRPAADFLRTPLPTQQLGWPGFGDVPRNTTINSLQDLAGLALEQIDRPTALVAQSMGGVVAVQVALQRPELISHLVLSVTSGGLDVSALGGEDWRDEFAADFPTLPRWFLDDRTDLSARLHELRMPVMLVWGGRDRIIPLRVGQRLAELIPGARLEVFAEAGHDLGFTHAQAVARLIDQHLSV